MLTAAKKKKKKKNPFPEILGCPWDNPLKFFDSANLYTVYYRFSIVNYLFLTWVARNDRQSQRKIEWRVITSLWSVLVVLRRSTWRKSGGYPTNTAAVSLWKPWTLNRTLGLRARELGPRELRYVKALSATVPSLKATLNSRPHTLWLHELIYIWKKVITPLV